MYDYPVHDAVKRKDPKKLELVLNSVVKVVKKQYYYADVNEKNKAKESPLHIAISKKNNLEVIRILLKYHANVNQRNKFGSTPLHWAVQIPNNDRAVKLLLNYGADVNAIDNAQQSTPLHCAVEIKNNIEVINILLQYGANVNAKEKNGVTALHYAALNSHLDEIKLLLKNGADIHAEEWFKFTCLHVAAKKKKNAEVLQFLIQHGAQIDARDKRRRTALYLAVFHGNLYNVETLLNLNADVYCTPKLVEQLMKKASDKKHRGTKKSVDKLLEHIVNLNKKNLLSNENIVVWKSTCNI